MKKLCQTLNLILLQLMVCLFYFSDAFAQDIYVGVKGGISIPNINGGNKDQNIAFRSRIAPSISLFTCSELKNQFAIQIECSYAGYGGIRNGYQKIDSGMINYRVPASDTLWADFKYELAFYYFDVPVLAKYTIPIEKKFKLSFALGPDIGILLGAKTKTNGTSQVYTDTYGTPLTDKNGTPLPPIDFNSNKKITSEVNMLNAGITGGIGFMNDLNSGELSLEIRGSYGLTNIWKDTRNGESHNYCFLIAVGYRMKYYTFKKKL